MKKSCLYIILCSFFFLGAASPEATVYKVRSGDTLSHIAARYMPYTRAYTRRELIENIRSINGINGPLSIGQSLTIPVAWDEPVSPRTVSRPKDFPAMGLYMNPASAGTRFIFDSAAKLRESGGNTIVFDAKDDLGAITYPSPIPARYAPNERYSPNIEDLSKLIQYLHQIDIHVVARVVAFRDPIMSRSHPEWCIDRKNNWLNPAGPEVQEYLLSVIRELVGSGVDEIQLDYIRYHADGKTGTGIEGRARTDVIASFLERVHEITSKAGVLLSVDMFGIVIWQRDVDVLVVGQDIAKMKPHVDIVSPMLYPSHFSAGFDGVENPADDPYYFVYKGVKRMRELLGDEVIVRPWLQSFPLRVTRGFDASYIRDQIDASRDAGGTGWLLWSPGNHYENAYAAMGRTPESPEAVVLPAAGEGSREAAPVHPVPAGAVQPAGSEDVESFEHGQIPASRPSAARNVDAVKDASPSGAISPDSIPGPAVSGHAGKSYPSGSGNGVMEPDLDENAQDTLKPARSGSQTVPVNRPALGQGAAAPDSTETVSEHRAGSRGAEQEPPRADTANKPGSPAQTLNGPDRETPDTRNSTAAGVAPEPVTDKAAAGNSPSRTPPSPSRQAAEPIDPLPQDGITGPVRP